MSLNSPPPCRKWEACPSMKSVKLSPDRLLPAEKSNSPDIVKVFTRWFFKRTTSPPKCSSCAPRCSVTSSWTVQSPRLKSPRWFVPKPKYPPTSSDISGGVGAAICTPASGNPKGAPESDPPVCASHPNQVLNNSVGV